MPVYNNKPYSNESLFAYALNIQTYWRYRNITFGNTMIETSCNAYATFSVLHNKGQPITDSNITFNQTSCGGGGVGAHN